MPCQGYHLWHCERNAMQFVLRELVWTIYLNDMPEGEGETELAIKTNFRPEISYKPYAIEYDIYDARFEKGILKWEDRNDGGKIVSNPTKEIKSLFGLLLLKSSNVKRKYLGPKVSNKEVAVVF